MIKINLTKNDIIVIIIIFMCYVVFTLYNTRSIFEKFETSSSTVTTNININKCSDSTERNTCMPKCFRHKNELLVIYNHIYSFLERYC